MNKSAAARMGETLSSLTKLVFALCTEDETGYLLDQRLKEIRAWAEALVAHAEAVVKSRSDADDNRTGLE